MRIADRPNVFDYRWGVDNDNWKDEGIGGSYPRLHIKVKPNTYYTISWDIGKYLQDPVTSSLYVAVNNNDEPSYQGRNWLFHQTTVSLQKASTTKKSSPTGFLYLECRMTNFADRPKVFNENIKWCIMEGTLENTFIPYTDGFDRRKIIDSGELVSYCERYGMEVQDEIRVNQLYNPSITSSNTANGITYSQNADGTLTFSGTSTTNNWIFIRHIGIVSGHKYLMIPFGSYQTYYLTDGNGFINSFEPIKTVNYNRLSIFLIVRQGVSVDMTIKPFLRDLTSLGLADKSLEWLQTNRPDLFQNTEYIPETKTIKSIKRRIM